MTVWELLACLDGVNEANGATPAMQPDEYDDIMRAVYGDDHGKD